MSLTARPSLLRTAPVAIVFAVASMLSVPVSASAQQEAGTARFVKAAESSFDRYTKSPSATQQSWMRGKYWRMRAYAPYFDSRLSWFSDAWAYQDLYAIYVGQELAAAHPEWILRDGAGNRLYIPFGCSGGRCPQYAGDVGNPAFRAHWIAEAKAKMAKGYRGLFVDDVNMEFRVGNGNGHQVAPRDPRTGQTMTEAAWRRYVAMFCEEIRAALPNVEIVHNAIWFSGYQDAYVKRELDAADYIELERGVNDGGIRGGFGRFGWQTFMARIDYLHSRGKGVIFDSHAKSDAEREYGLASYFLVSSGRDGIGNDPGGTPDDWWQGYDASLGAPRGARYRWNGLFRRDFQRGIVLVNQPDEPRRTVNLGGEMLGLAGQRRTSVTLDGAQGAVLASATSAATPLPAATPPRSTPSRAATSTEIWSFANPRRRFAARTLRMFRAILVTGKVRRVNGGQARIRVRRKVNGRWLTLSHLRVPVRRDGSFSKLYTGLRRGQYKVRGGYLGSRNAKLSLSSFRHLRLRR